MLQLKKTEEKIKIDDKFNFLKRNKSPNKNEKVISFFAKTLLLIIMPFFISGIVLINDLSPIKYSNEISKNGIELTQNIKEIDFKKNNEKTLIKKYEDINSYITKKGEIYLISLTTKDLEMIITEIDFKTIDIKNEYLNNNISKRSFENIIKNYSNTRNIIVSELDERNEEVMHIMKKSIYYDLAVSVNEDNSINSILKYQKKLKTFSFDLIVTDKYNEYFKIKDSLGKGEYIAKIYKSIL